MSPEQCIKKTVYDRSIAKGANERQATLQSEQAVENYRKNTYRSISHLMDYHVKISVKS